jgi:hypothetical protein
MPLLMRWTPARSVQVALALTAVAGAARLPAQARPPSPTEVLGFRPGTDSLLADWREIGAYLSRLATASPVVRLDTIGRSTLGRPLLLVTVASEANQSRLAQLRGWQTRLADPRLLPAAAEDSLVAAAPAVVLISNAIHSTEIASSQMQLELIWRLAAEPAWRRLLDSLVVLIVPSANPDGVDTVVGWYRQYRGTPFEAGPIPWLYHPYAGHDNNRDWFMLTQVETQAISRVLYREWFPAVVWDVHQMGSSGARLFVPPFSDPVNPNLDPVLLEAINLVGTAMGTAVLDAGKTGVAHQERFDLWWHGGFRTVPARHNMIGILSEAASVRLASPVFLHADSLRQPEAGVMFPAPWPGGWWRLGDVVEYELLAARGLLQLVASQRTEFVRRFVTLGRRQIAAGAAGNPAAFLVPEAQRDRGASALLLNNLIATGVEVHQATAPFAADGRTYPPGTYVIRLDQPFRAHVKDLLETQRYRERRSANGDLIRPYDVTGWTLGLQMGVDVVTVQAPFTATAAPVDGARPAAGIVSGSGPQWVLSNRANAESRAIAMALGMGAQAWVQLSATSSAGQRIPAGSVILEDVTASAERALLERAAADGFDARRVEGLARPEVGLVTRMPRVGLYRPWTASIDEGWTRWVFEQYGIPFRSVTDSMVRSGNLNSYLDILVLPDLTPESIRSGLSASRAPPRYTGGLGESGVRSVTEFVRGGGTLVALDASSDFAISTLNLPVGNTLAQGADTSRGSRFSAPGSIFGVAVAPEAGALGSGLPDTVAVFMADSRAFEVSGEGRVLARFVDRPLLSGFAHREEMVAGKAAAVAVNAGRGQVILVGFRPQHRGQTHATFKLLLNAVLFGAAR